MNPVAILESLFPQQRRRKTEPPIGSVPLLGSPSLPNVAPPTGPPQVPMRPPSVDLSSHHSAADFVRALIPMITSTLLARKDPMLGAALLNGYTRGATLARQERMQDEERAADKANISLQFDREMLNHIATIKDPVELSRYLVLADEAGQALGKPKGWTQKLQLPRQSATDALRNEIREKLAQFENGAKNPNDLWREYRGTAREYDINLPALSNGSHISVGAAKELLNLQFTDADGKPFYPQKPEPTEGTETERTARLLSRIRTAKARGDMEKAAELQATYDDLIQAKRDGTATPVGSDRERAARLLDGERIANARGDRPAAARFRQQYDDLLRVTRQMSDAGRAPAVTVSIPGMAGMSPTERVETAANDIIAGRLSPSQLATFFVGMGKDSASQLRSYVMQRVKQIDPEFNFATAESNYQFGKAPSTQNTVRYLENIQKTIPMLRAANQQFKRSNVRLVNDVIRSGKSQFGNIDVADFEFKRTLLADEIAKVLQGGGTGSGTSDAKLKQASDLLASDMSPAQFETVLNAAEEMLNARRETLTRGTVNERKSGLTKKIGRFEVTVK